MTKYASNKDIHFCIQVLKMARDKLNMTESYTKIKLVPSMNRVILELEDMIEK